MEILGKIWDELLYSTKKHMKNIPSTLGINIKKEGGIHYFRKYKMNIQYTIYNIQYTIYNIQYTIYNI